MTTTIHLTFHADRPAVSVARTLSAQFELDFTEHQDPQRGRSFVCEGHVLADRLAVAGFTAAHPHVECPDIRHMAHLRADFTRGRVRDRGARRDYLLRLLTHMDGLTLVSQTFAED